MILKKKPSRFGTEPLVVFENQIILEKDAINRITGQVGVEPLKTRQNFLAEEVEPLRWDYLLSFKFVKKRPKPIHVLKTVICKSCRHPCQHPQTVAIGDLYDWPQNIVHNRSILGLEINPRWVLRSGELIESIPPILKDPEDQCVDAGFSQMFDFLFHSLEIIRVEKAHLCSYNPVRP